MIKDQLRKVDSTKVSDSLGCLAYFYLRHIRGFVPDAPSLPLIFGQAIHAGLAEHYRGNGAKAIFRAFDTVWLEGAQGRSDNKRSAARGLAILRDYLQRYPTEYFTILAIEEHFMIPIGPIIWMGIIDLVAEWQDSKRLLVMDHKTSSSLTAYYWLQYRANADYQGPGYLTAVSKIIGPAETFVPNVLLVDATKTGFERQTFTPDKDSFQRSLLHWHKIISLHAEANCWPKNGKQCNRWARCDYLNLCEIYSDVADSQLIEGYRIEHWDPTAALHRVAG